MLVNRNGKQFQKLTDLFSILDFQAIGKYVHPTRYRQIIETQSSDVLLPKEQKWMSEDQKHSSNVARVHYQKKRSREVAERGHLCMSKLLETESSNVENEVEKTIENNNNETTDQFNSASQGNELVKITPKHSTDKSFRRRAGV